MRNQKKGIVIKLSHWQHDSIVSGRKPNLGDLHQITEGPEAWAHCINTLVLSQKKKKKKIQEDKKGLVCEPD